ncbi:methyltransferase domain-containing protein [Methylocapsa polymorpha]|uniref:Methyltransferase domain-containing protein n=1 Tax=Methylocapsa polymorpha TaxID=3080828 RepID=A0ABZ0HQB9_9HYPH|nr:methyltransferase domain-containing protein [Methylocapsa sp. RX1]
MYDFEWHKAHGDETSQSAQIIVPLLKSFCDVKSVLDVGCGDGQWLKCFESLGTPQILGVDGPWTDCGRLVIRPDLVRIQDLSNTLEIDRRFDLAMSLEVAEHIEGKFSKQFVENLTKHADLVLFSGAIPYQGGFRHINERWQSYWADLFNAQGYDVFDPFRSQIWDKKNVSVWYKQNMLFYVKRERHDLIANVKDYLFSNKINQLPIDVVHPRQYEAIASYSQIAFKPLMRKLPKQTFNKLSTILSGKI